MKKSVLFISVLFLSLSSFSQGEFNNWYFGFNCGINFNTTPPSATTNGAVHISDQTSTISDASGNLIMYSDGLHVYNRNHVQMPNGFDLLGYGANYSHASIIVRKPGSTNLFYIFTLTYFAYPEGFKYAIVDMNLQGGMGDVTSKNNALLTPVCEKLTAVKHQNGTDIWIITHQWNTNAFYAYLLTASGINPPVITHIGPVHTGGDYNAQGQMASTPDGSRLALAIYDDAMFEVYNFNIATGTVSNQIQIPGYSNAWGVQFSPDGSKLYATKWTFAPVYQFNLLAGSPTAIANSATIVGNCTSPNPGYMAGFMQLGPDNKVYVAKMDAAYVSVINNPNGLGTACNFVDNGLYLAGKTCQAGLPQYIQTPFSIPDFTFQNVCQGTTVPFQSQNLSGFNSFNWNFGDPISGSNNTSTLQNPSHYYANPGNYTITLIAHQGSISDTIVHIITIYPIPQVNLG
ncbi:MAG: PKD domain-containing protein, partial [Bacteroidota bacterium]